MALTPEEQQRRDELERLLREQDEDAAAVAEFQRHQEEVRKFKEEGQ